MKQNKGDKPVYGITGGIGSGKSFAAKVIAEKLGLLYVDTDTLAREQMQKGGRSYEAVILEFGEDILGEDGQIDRSRLSAIVFSDENALRRLNAITHPNVIEEMKDRIDKSNMPGALVESALIIEAGLTDFFDFVFVVEAPFDTRVNRLITNRGYTRERAEAVIAAQKPDSAYEAIADGVIANPEGTEAQKLVTQAIALLTEKTYGK